MLSGILAVPSPTSEAATNTTSPSSSGVDVGSVLALQPVASSPSNREDQGSGHRVRFERHLMRVYELLEVGRPMIVASGW